MDKFILFLFLMFGIGMTCFGIGMTFQKNEIWDSCVGKGTVTINDTLLTCVALEGKWKGHPVEFKVPTNEPKN